jgi:large subunit ribosomal protein L6
MSRIGKKPIQIEKDVKVTLTDTNVHVEGPNGTLDVKIPLELKVAIEGEVMTLEIKDDPSSLGLYRSLIANAVKGVKEKWTKTLELVGVGFRATTTGSELVLNVGFSHPVKIPAPSGITFTVVENKIKVIGADKYTVGEIAANIRRVKKPEPYKGKGIRYEGEVIRKKLGKAAKAVGGAGGAK